MAYVLSSVSGNLISAASAGYAPTNSADVSAIASAYQVVSSTATQLYAGTAYVTSVNDAPISAARAGNAANASLANSAWYDGTGRFISALPDSAAVSAIASSYVESGVSSKQDTLSFAYNTADQISSINGSALGGMDEAAVSAIASSYAESAASSKQYTLTFGYNTADQISSIDGSALGGMDEAAVSGIASAYAESAVSAASSNYYPATSNPSGYLTAQTQASWSESASASPSYIQDKPDLVDIVAGPGIVIDNPDGNTLRVSLGISGSWTDVATEASYNTTNIRAGSFKIMYNPALNLVALTCDVNVGAGESTFFTWSNRLKPVFNDMALGSNLYVGQSGLKQAAGSTSRWINGAFMWPVVGGN